MTATDLTPQKVSQASGIANLTWSATPAGGHAIVGNDGKMLLIVKNAGGSDDTVTVTPQATVNGASITAPTIVVPQTSGFGVIGPFDPSVFNDSNNKVQVGYSYTTSGSAAAVQLP